MDNLFQQLDQIESTASAILERANTRKKELAKEQEQRIQAYTAEKHRQTEELIRQKKEQTQIQINSELSRERELTARQLTLLEQEYETSHTILAKQLLAQIIKE